VHRRRAHLVLVAMRRFAAELRAGGEVEVLERRGAASFADGLHGLRDVVCAAPNSAGARRGLGRLGVRLVASNQFLTDPDDFAAWARGRRRVVMEDFYREQRRRFGVLLDEDGQPEGGRWNFDAENRRPPPRAGFDAPVPWRPAEDAVDADVRADLDAAGIELFGADGPRRFAATPAEARSALASFVADRLPSFGPWQDAMVPGRRVLFHSLLSAPLNLGLLEPLEAIRTAERAYRRGEAPLASVEGFVRQILGWREYVWGTYWLRRDRWPHESKLGARAPLPRAYWGEPSGWNCLDSVVAGVRADAYAHHIERLMVLGNIALLAGIEPWATVRWFQGAFIDGAEWVMAPNAAGMALFADGGEMMTKPYAAGGNYINRMSGYCAGCRYRPNVRTGPEACPVTALYWDFVDRHRERLAANRRTRSSVRTLDRFDPGEREGIRARARDARAELGGG
jgi:(6-4)DNA photolyase